jgi:hypothetical protein
MYLQILCLQKVRNKANIAVPIFTPTRGREKSRPLSFGEHMSHSVVHVILPGNTPESDLGKCLEEALAPFDENLEIPTGQMEECGCVDEGKADTDCSACKGSGQAEITRNPKARWDWYVVGGRWSGSLDENNQKLYLDPTLLRDCYYCKGTQQVKVTNPHHKDFGEKIDCPDCEKGKVPDSKKIDPFWNDGSHDVTTVAHVVALLETFPKVRPFAILTPDGEWHEKGEMGWFGMVKDEKKVAEWTNTVKEIYGKYPDAILIAVDVHI